MIKINGIYIEETRGIRKLRLKPDGKCLSISGPNGSGKSGVIDAIEFGLTGSISRLAGVGTKGLSVSEHGPHVDKAKFPDASFVELDLYLERIEKSVKIKRFLKKPNKPEIEPQSDVILGELDSIAEHPEISLSRREIIKFILTSPTDRSKEIQSILKLDRLGETRAAFQSAQNSLERKRATASSQVDNTKNALCGHLGIEELTKDGVLKIINTHRLVLSVKAIDDLLPQTRLDESLSGVDAKIDINKKSSLAAVRSVVTRIHEKEQFIAERESSLGSVAKKVMEDKTLLESIQQQSLIEKGIELVSGNDCPLCDTPWADQDALLSHLQEKLEKSKEAKKISVKFENYGKDLRVAIDDLVGILSEVRKLSTSKQVACTSEAEVLSEMIESLTREAGGINNFEGLLAYSSSDSVLRFVPRSKLERIVNRIEAVVDKLPDQSTVVNAHTYLATAQAKLVDYRSSKKAYQKAATSAKSAKTAHDLYCDVLTTELNKLYNDVQQDFSSYYRTINEDDEAEFTAKLTPEKGSLSLDVNFYERGLYPPGAYHSEGHQDGMGVCLYLSLMKNLFGDNFSFALLDDVVMSVDSGHRREFCKLLKNKFPDTQFILTTHDRLWAQQMRTERLVSSRSSVVFHGWSVDSGPLVESSVEIWDDISQALSKGKVESAAHSLRRHLEYTATQLCEDLGASPQFRADGNYDLGALLPAAQKRLKELLTKASKAAESWGNTELRDRANEHKKRLSSSSAVSQMEQWAVNKAVHYNEWANFGRTDFKPVVEAFKELAAIFQCNACKRHLHTSPKVSPESLRCDYGTVNYNLSLKKR